MTDFPKRLRAARLRAGYTQEGLAAALGVDRTLPSLWETGKIQPGMESLERIGVGLGCSLDYLLLGHDPEERVLRAMREKDGEGARKPPRGAGARGKCNACGRTIGVYARWHRDRQGQRCYGKVANG